MCFFLLSPPLKKNKNSHLNFELKRGWEGIVTCALFPPFFYIADCISSCAQRLNPGATKWRVWSVWGITWSLLRVNFLCALRCHVVWGCILNTYYCVFSLDLQSTHEATCWVLDLESWRWTLCEVFCWHFTTWKINTNSTRRHTHMCSCAFMCISLISLRGGDISPPAFISFRRGESSCQYVRHVHSVSNSHVWFLLLCLSVCVHERAAERKTVCTFWARICQMW